MLAKCKPIRELTKGRTVVRCWKVSQGEGKHWRDGGEEDLWYAVHDWPSYGRKKGSAVGIMKAQCKSWLLISPTRIFSDICYARPTDRCGA